MRSRRPNKIPDLVVMTENRPRDPEPSDTNLAADLGIQGLLREIFPDLDPDVVARVLGLTADLADPADPAQSQADSDQEK
jgi:hypothetical protein